MADQPVRTSEIPWIAVVVEADPDFYKAEINQHGYEFSNGVKKKAPNEQGIYQQP
jgi:hypothetical protein